MVFARRFRLRSRGTTAGAVHSRLLIALVLLIGVVLGAVVYRVRTSGTVFQSESPAGAASQSPEVSPWPSVEVLKAYGGSQSCANCHQEEFAAWKRSNHGLAERLPASELDRAAFDPARTFRHGSQSTKVLWTNNTGVIQAPGLLSPAEAHPVARVIGNRPLRQFLMAFPGGRFQVSEAAYDPRSNAWFNVYGEEDRQPGEWGHWTGRGMNWNSMCAACHNTRLLRKYEPATDAYETAMAEASVGCEACHGPLKVHNRWQNEFGKSGRTDTTLKKLSPAQTVDYCGSCHARRTELTGDFQPGDAFLDRFQLAMVDQAGHYYADGQIKDEDYEYGSFLGSRMHARGVTCMDCHDPHTLKTRLPGNWLCLRCHSGSDTNAPVINPVTHSRHKVFGFGTNGEPENLDLSSYVPGRIKETGGECVNCHMPQTVYMQRHWRHDHGFTCPDPLLTKKLGIPNACNRCHQDKDADWALKYCDQWYGTNMDRATRARALTIAAGLKGEPQSVTNLSAILRHESSPYWQAVAAGLLSQFSANEAIVTELTQALENTNALVRTTAASALQPAVLMGQAKAVEALRRCLEDPVRSVRVAAALTLRAPLPQDSRAARDLDLYFASNADQPAGQVEQAVYLFALGRLEPALEHLQKAEEWDPRSPAIRQELAVVLSALNRPREAVRTLEQACELAPQNAESHFRLGLAYNEAGDLNNAVDQLSRAAELNPADSRAWYNLGLAQNAIGAQETAISSLARAEAADPADPRAPYARATILVQIGRSAEARTALRRALELNPNFSDAKQLLQNLSN